MIVHMNTLLTTREAGHRLGLKSVTIRKYISQGRLSATRLGRDWLVKIEDLDALIRNPVGNPNLLAGIGLRPKARKKKKRC
jgi:excisionase family DNA binding protein